MEDYIKQYEIFYENGGYGNNDPVIVARHRIKSHIDKTGSKTLLDFGCGECLHYKVNKLHEYWGIGELRCYDPAISEYAERPTKKYDAVINTDVLEHIPEYDLANVIQDIFDHAEKMVYLRIATSPARAILPNGDNAHCTLKTHNEWVELVRDFKKDQYTVIETWGKSPGITLL